MAAKIEKTLKETSDVLYTTDDHQRDSEKIIGQLRPHLADNEVKLVIASRLRDSLEAYIRTPTGALWSIVIAHLAAYQNLRGK